MTTHDDCFWKARCAGRSLRTSHVPGSCAELGPAVPAGRERRRGRLAREIQATGGIPCGPRRWIWGSCHSGSQCGPHGPRFLPAALRGSSGQPDGARAAPRAPGTCRSPAAVWARVRGLPMLVLPTPRRSPPGILDGAPFPPAHGDRQRAPRTPARNPAAGAARFRSGRRFGKSKDRNRKTAASRPRGSRGTSCAAGRRRQNCFGRSAGPSIKTTPLSSSLGHSGFYGPGIWELATKFQTGSCCSKKMLFCRWRKWASYLESR